MPKFFPSNRAQSTQPVLHIKAMCPPNALSHPPPAPPTPLAPPTSCPSQFLPHSPPASPTSYPTYIPLCPAYFLPHLPTAPPTSCLGSLLSRLLPTPPTSCPAYFLHHPPPAPPTSCLGYLLFHLLPAPPISCPTHLHQTHKLGMLLFTLQTLSQFLSGTDRHSERPCCTRLMISPPLA